MSNAKRRAHMNEIMDAKFVKSAYLNFLIWGVCSSLGITVSTIVDATLIGNFIGSGGLAVANIATPVFLAYSLIGITIGMGANVIIGKKLGASETDEANRIFNAQLFTGAAVSAVCLALFALFSDELLGLLGARGELLPLARQYLTVVLFSAPLFIFYHILSVSVRTDGDPKLAAISSAVVIIVNLALDIVFLSVLKWGIVGASASLCIAEAMGLAVLLLHFKRKTSLLKPRLCVPKPADVKSFVTGGFGVGSSFIFQAVVMLTFNTLLLSSGKSSGVLYVAIFGVIYTVGTIPFAVFDGAGSAASTVASILLGERDVDSVIVVLRKCVATAVIAGTAVALMFWLCAGYIVAFFGITDAGALSTAVPALRVFSLSIVFTGVNSVVTSFWQAVGRVRLASAMSVARNLVLMLALGSVLISRFGIMGLSAAYVCVEACCLIIVLMVLAFRRSVTYLKQRYPQSSRVYEKYYLIQTQSLSQVSSDLEQLCGKWEISAGQAFFINFIAEEIILNIIKLGLKDSEKKHYIAIKLLDNNGEYIVRIRDNVNAYNPFESSGDDIDNAVIRMITKKTKYYDYQRKLIFNYLYLIV